MRLDRGGGPNFRGVKSAEGGVGAAYTLRFGAGLVSIIVTTLLTSGG